MLLLHVKYNGHHRINLKYETSPMSATNMTPIRIKITFCLYTLSSTIKRWSDYRGHPDSLSYHSLNFPMWPVNICICSSQLMFVIAWATEGEEWQLTVSRAFSICSLCPRKPFRISAPYISVSKAIRVEFTIRLLPSSSISAPANSLVCSPKGSSDVPTLPLPLVPGTKWAGVRALRSLRGDRPLS